MALCAFAPAVGLINMQHFQWDARRCKGLGQCEEHAVLCAPLSSEGGRFRKQKCELSWEKLLIMVWKKFCVGLDCVWLQGAPVPLGTIAQTLLWRHRLLILPYFFNKISADRHSLANWSVVDTVPPCASTWHWCPQVSLGAGCYWVVPGQPHSLHCFSTALVFVLPQKRGKEAEWAALHFGEGGKTLPWIRPYPSRYVCGRCVLCIIRQRVQWFPASVPWGDAQIGPPGSSWAPLGREVETSCGQG